MISRLHGTGNHPRQCSGGKWAGRILGSTGRGSKDIHLNPSRRGMVALCRPREALLVQSGQCQSLSSCLTHFIRTVVTVRVRILAA